MQNDLMYQINHRHLDKTWIANKRMPMITSCKDLKVSEEMHFEGASGQMTIWRHNMDTLSSLLDPCGRDPSIVCRFLSERVSNELRYFLLYHLSLIIEATMYGLRVVWSITLNFDRRVGISAVEAKFIHRFSVYKSNNLGVTWRWLIHQSGN